MSYEIHWEERGVVKRFFGHLDSHDMLQSIIDTEGNARFDNLRYVINDFLGVTSMNLADLDLEEISAIDYAAAGINPNIKIAVVSIDPEIIALANQYAESPINAYPTRIFTALHAAMAWIEETTHHRQ